MMEGLIELAIKSIGIDPVMIARKAQEIGEAFDQVNRELATIRAQQETMMAHMGLYVPPPTDAALALIAQESRKFTEPTDPASGVAA